MKKKVVIITTIIMIAAIMSVVLMGCSAMKVDEIFGLADFSIASEESGRDVSVKITSTNVGEEVVVYDMLNGTINKQLEGFDFSGLVFGTNGAALSLKHENFTEAEFSIDKEKIATYTAKIADAQALMGITIDNGSIEIKANAKENRLISNTLKYTQTKSGFTFNVVISVTMKY